MNLKLSLGAFALLTEAAQGKLRGNRQLDVSFTVDVDECPTTKYFDQVLPWYYDMKAQRVDCDCEHSKDCLYPYKPDVGNPVCTGSVCGLWGDPHIQTCDDTELGGSGWGCQVEGTVSLMNNNWYNIQATFSGIGEDAIEHVREQQFKKGKDPTIHNVGATSTTDVAFNFKDSNTTLQFGYANINSNIYKNGTAILGDIPSGPNAGRPYFPSEQYCNVYQYYQLENSNTTIENKKFGKCAKACQKHEDCKYFNWYSTKVCELILGEGVLVDAEKHEGRVVSGRKRTAWDDEETCGHWLNKGIPFDKWPEGTEDSQEKHREVGGWSQCPLLFFVDGELQDISNLDEAQKNAETGHKTPREGYLYGDKTSDLSAKMLNDGNNDYADAIQILHKRGQSVTEIIVEFSGSGQAELWACSFKMHICLPEEITNNGSNVLGETVGLLGSPDGIFENDQLHKDGVTPFDVHEAWKAMKNQHADKPDNCLHALAKLEYCHDTFCVDESDLIMAPAPGQTKSDLLCEPVTETCAEDFCQIPDSVLKDHCGDWKDVDKNDDHAWEIFETCRIECCHLDDPACQATDPTPSPTTSPSASPTPNLNPTFKELGDDDDDDPRGHCEDGQEFPNTGTTVCPGHNIVEILRGPPDSDPAVAQDIFYDINTDAGHESQPSVSFRVNNPFGVEADVYVSHDKRARENSDFPEPTCEGMLGVKGGCDPRAANEVTVPCITHAGLEPFAMVNLYFVSNEASFPDVDPEAEVKRCCIEKDERDTLYADSEYKVIHYAFQVTCGCPESLLED